MTVGTFAGIWQFEGTTPYQGYYVNEFDNIGYSDSTFGPGTTDLSQATLFAIYDSGNNNIQVQAQHRNQWMGDVQAGLYALSDPYTIQYSGAFGGTVQLLSAWAWVTLAGNVPKKPDPTLALVWLGEFAHFPLVSHLVVPSLAAIQQSKQAPGTDFTHVILDGADLSGVNLTGANFANASLKQVSLAGANLSGANLAGQDLRGCKLIGANLTGADLQGTGLSGVHFDPSTNLAGADLRAANLAGATLAGVNLSEADLRGANLDGVDLTGANLAGTDFSGLDLRNTTFGANPKFSTNPRVLTKFSNATLPFAVIGLNWSYLDLVGAHIPGIPADTSGHFSLRGLQAIAANLAGWVFSDANLRAAEDVGTSFSEANLVSADFSGSDCTGATFEGASLGGAPGQTAATLSAAMLFDVSFRDAQLSGVNFSSAYLYGTSATVSGATMADADLSNAYLTGLDLSNVQDANMAGAVFDGACLVNCNFKGTTVQPNKNERGGSFVRACLHGADFTDASLDGADLVDAGVAEPCPTPGTCKFPATLTINGQPVKIDITINQAGTVLPRCITTTRTVCPNHTKGPCADTQLVSPQAPKAWPVAAAPRAPSA